MNPSPAILVSLCGVAIGGVGLLGVVAPTVLTRLLSRWRVVIRLPVTFALRIIFGSIFVIAAPDCRLPSVVSFIGWFEFGFALVLLGSGAERLDRFGDWWLQQPRSFVRRWCLLGGTPIGVVLVYAGA
jgi:hypothetical protein